MEGLKIKKKKILIVSALLIANIMIIPFVTAYPYSSSDDVIINGLDYLRGQQGDDGNIGGFGVSAWVVMAISAAGEDPHSWKKNADSPSVVAYLRNNSHQLDQNDSLDWSRSILAITAAYDDPTNFGGIDYVAKIKSFYDDNQIGDPTLLNDDFWGILALISAGETEDSEIVQASKNYIISYQNSDGGWSYGAGLSSDIDNTAAAIMALISTGIDKNSDIIQKGLLYIKQGQNADGGFPTLPGIKSNCASTSWAIDAIVKVGQSPVSTNWTNNVSKNPVDYLLNLQNDDGSFNYTTTSKSAPQWTTAYAIPALMGKPYPVVILQSSQPINPPTNPLSLQAFAGNSQVTLTWAKPSSNGGSTITNYRIYRGTISGGETFLTEIGNVTTFTNTGLTNGVTYYYKVSALNRVGEGPPSDEANATPTSGATVPSAPQNLRVFTYDGEIKLIWDLPSFDGGSMITNYKIYRGTASDGEKFLIEIGNTSYHNDTTVINGVTYYFKVSAVNGVGEGPLSDEAIATPATVPSAPLVLTVTSGDSYINITWAAPASSGGSNVISYILYRSKLSGEENFLTETRNILFYNDTKVSNGVTYYYKVSAVNTVGEGHLSDEASATPFTVPSAPIGLTGIAGDSYVYITWAPPALNGGYPITNYRIYRGEAHDGVTFLTEIGNIALYNDTTVTNGVTYCYRVSAVSFVGEGALSNEMSGTPSTSSATPVQPTDQDIELPWLWIIITIIIAVIVLVFIVIFTIRRKRKDKQTPSQSQYP